ncbi:hypothetical protein N7540_011071 [Penicillium herquei]|nr:hypothetical protein N7540_011071 [Penicillium herquei]
MMRPRSIPKMQGLNNNEAISNLQVETISRPDHDNSQAKINGRALGSAMNERLAIKNETTKQQLANQQTKI